MFCFSTSRRALQASGSHLRRNPIVFHAGLARASLLKVTPVHDLRRPSKDVGGG